jgi:hypothetical protein
MNHVNFFARRIVSVIALAMLVSGGWSQVIHAQPAGSTRKPTKFCDA